MFLPLPVTSRDQVFGPGMPSAPAPLQPWARWKAWVAQPSAADQRGPGPEV